MGQLEGMKKVRAIEIVSILNMKGFKKIKKEKIKDLMANHDKIVYDDVIDVY